MVDFSTLNSIIITIQFNVFVATFLQIFSLFLSDSQLRTALAIVLRGDVDQGWWNHYGLKCASWTAVNSGTSGRSPCSSIGNLNHASVCEANCLGSRILVWKFRHTFTCLHLRTSHRVQTIYVSNLKKEYVIPSSPLWVPAMRMLLLMMLAVCLNAVITLEQPYSSFFEFYPRFRDFIRMLQHTGGPHAAPCPWISKW